MKQVGCLLVYLKGKVIHLTGITTLSSVSDLRLHASQCHSKTCRLRNPLSYLCSGFPGKFSDIFLSFEK